MNATEPVPSRYNQLSKLAAVTRLPDPEPLLAELDHRGVVGVGRYHNKLASVLASIAKRLTTAAAKGIAVDVEEGEEEYYALTREGVVARWLAAHEVQVTMEPRYPRPGPDLLAELDGQTVYFEVKRLKIVLNPDSDSRNARVTDTVADAHRQLVDGAANVVVIIDRDPTRHTDEVEDALNGLATSASQAGTLKRLSAVLYEAPLSVGPDPLPSGWLFRAFTSGAVSLPHRFGRVIQDAFQTRDIEPTDVGDWISGQRFVLDR